MSITDAIKELTTFKKYVLDQNNDDLTFTVIPLIQFCHTYGAYNEDDFQKILKKSNNENDFNDQGEYSDALEKIKDCVPQILQQIKGDRNYTQDKLDSIIAAASLETIDLKQTSDSAHKSHP